MNLRDAVEADLPAIIAIYNAAVATRIATAQLEPVTVEERLPWFRNHAPTKHPIWVAETEEIVAGWLSMSEFITRCAYHSTAEISVYVQENFRGRGLAEALLGKAIEGAPALGLNVFVGLIFGHNEPSLRLFAKLGFARWGLLPRVARLDGLERDLVIMGRHLDSA